MQKIPAGVASREKVQEMTRANEPKPDAAACWSAGTARSSGWALT